METNEIKVGDYINVYRTENEPYTPTDVMPKGSWNAGVDNYPGVQCLSRCDGISTLYMSLLGEQVKLVGRMIITKLK